METQQTNASVDMEPIRIERDIKGRFKEGHIVPKDVRQSISKSLSGRELSDDTKSLMSKSAKERNTCSRLQGLLNKVWEVETPTRKVIKVDDLQAFCVEHSLSRDCMYRVARGERPHHREYRIKELLNE